MPSSPGLKETLQREAGISDGLWRTNMKGGGWDLNMTQVLILINETPFRYDNACSHLPSCRASSSDLTLEPAPPPTWQTYSISEAPCLRTAAVFLPQRLPGGHRRSWGRSTKKRSVSLETPTRTHSSPPLSPSRWKMPSKARSDHECGHVTPPPLPILPWHPKW